MLGLIERLEHVRAIGIEPARGDLAAPARAWPNSPARRPHHGTACRRIRAAAPSCDVGSHQAGPQRHPDGSGYRSVRPAGRCHVPQGRGRHARAFQADGRAINEKVRLYARVGAALIAAREGRQDAFDAIAAVIPWERFRASVAEAEALARSEEFDPYQMLGEHYAGMRRWAPAFLAAFAFQGVPAAASLLRAIDTLREMNRSHGTQACRNPSRPASSASDGPGTSCLAVRSTGAITNSAYSPSCATGCVPGTFGSPAAADTAPSKSA